MAMDLGTLEEVDLRAKWTRESEEFTPWLAEEKNLTLLGDALGLDLEFQDTEVAVGPYSADILAKDTGTGRNVVIENQLDTTDHKHLGQLLMYGAVLDASVVVWIASAFTDEHRKTIDWLNNHTTEDLDFYGVQIELWRIGNSAPAPRFNVVARPAKVVGSPGKPVGGQDLSASKRLQLEFWTQVRDRLREMNVVHSLQTPRPQYWYDVAIGRSNFVISCTANTYENRIGVRLYLYQKVADRALEILSREREAIENEIGAVLSWNPSPEKQDKIIALHHPANLEKREEWGKYVDWMTRTIVQFGKAFRERIKNLNLSEAPPSEDEKEA